MSMPTKMMLQIKFLDGHPPIDVEERPTVTYRTDNGHEYTLPDLRIGWGDRNSDLHTGPRGVPRAIRMLPPRVYVDTISARYAISGTADVPPEEIARVQALVDRLWYEVPTVAAACEPFRRRLQEIHDQYVPRERPVGAPTTLDVVRSVVGRRRKISAEEMGAILAALADAGIVNLRNDYMPGTDAPPETASAVWAQACRGITCISVDSRGLRDGQVRYDEPGSMHPQQHAELTFVPADIDGSTIAYMRRHADRVLLVSREI